MNQIAPRSLPLATFSPLARSAILVALAVSSARAQDPTEKNAPRLEMSDPVACSKIEGVRKYKALDEAVITADEKLLVYSEPSNFVVDPIDGRYQIHLVEDFRVRRRGEKKPLFSKNDAIDYKTKFDSPNPIVYMQTVISLKGLPPGEYVLDLILRDLGGKRIPATRSLDFRVKPSPKPADVAPAKTVDDKPTTKPDKKPRRE